MIGLTGSNNSRVLPHHDLCLALSTCSIQMLTVVYNWPDWLTVDLCPQSPQSQYYTDVRLTIHPCQSCQISILLTKNSIKKKEKETPLWYRV